MSLAVPGLALLLAVSAAPIFSPTVSDADRRNAVNTMSRDELAAVMRETPPETLIASSLAVVERLGTYRYNMVKRERVRGSLLPKQGIDVFVREHPWAVRLHYLEGPSAGRKVIYNPSVREADFRIREAGLVSVLGSLWIGVDSRLAKDDSNHTVREAGMGNLLKRFSRDLDKAKPSGGFEVRHEGWDEQGLFCSVWIAPNGGKDFSAAKTRICTDLAAGVPGRVESHDLKGNLLESYLLTRVEPQTLADGFFHPEKM